MARVYAVIIAALAAAGAALVVRRRRQVATIARIVGDPSDDTRTDERGAVRSVQGATLIMPADALERIWNPMHLERLARTYWQYLGRATLGLVRVEYTEDARYVVLLRSPLRLLTFRKPEYQMDQTRGIVRWPIDQGLLVAKRGRGGDGALVIDVERCDPDPEDSSCVRLHVEVAVESFYPAIASGISRWVYENTQSRIHVLVCWRFLRSLARLEFDESRVGRFAKIEDVPNPPASDGRAAEFARAA